MKIKKSFIKLSATVPNVLLLLSILTSSVFFPATVIAQEIDQLPETEVVVDIPLDESEDILEEGIATGPVEEVLGTRDDIKPPLEKKKALDPSLEAPTNLGWNIRSKSLNTPGERPVDIACGGTTNADYYTYGDGKISHNWELSNAPVNALYQREWKTPGSGTWTTDGYAYTNDHTDFSTFGSSEGTEGEWNTRVRAWIDIDGNGLLDESIDEYSHWSNDCQVTYDRTRPAITLDLPLQDSLHSGTVGLQATGTEELDYINFWWKAEGEDYSNTAPHRRYHYIYDNGIQFKWSLDTLHAEMWGNDGTYHMTDGDYYFYAAGKDVAGNWARTDEIKIIVDNTPPDAPHLITPLNNSFVNGSSLTSQWSPISDADYYIYESYHDAGATDLRYHNTYTSTSKTATNVANAIFWWRVKSVDEAGNESDWSDLWKVTIDNDAPEVEITSHNDGDIVNGLQKISSKVFDVNLSHYWFVIEDSSGTTVAGPGPVHNDGPVVLPTFDWDTTGVDDGIYTIKLEARDKAGNKDPNQASVPADPGVENDSVDWVELTVDNTAPESTFDPNISGQTFNSLIKISGYSDDKFSHIVGVNLYYSPSGEDEWELIDKIENTTHSITPTLFRWSYAWTPTKDGTYDIKASAYDELGNEESSPIMTNITFDSTAPNVGPIRIVRDYAGLYINGWTGFTGSAKVTDSLSLVNTNSCEYMRDGTNWLKGDYTPWNSRCNFYIMGRLDDAEVLDMNVRVSDNAGNRGEGTQIARTADSQLPSVDVDIPNLFYGPKTFEASSTIQGSASDTVSKVRLVRVSLQRSDDGKYWRRTWNPYSSYAWRKGPQPRNNVLGTESWTYAGIFPTTFKNGETYTVTPYAWDQVHKKPGIGQSDSFIWDSQLPQDPTPSSSSHEVNSYSKDNTIEIAFSGAHDHGGSGIKGYYYSFSSSQEPPAINPSNWLDASISNTTSTPLADGEWWFNIRTVDNVNNITSTEHLGPFNIDTIPADIIWDTPLDGSIHNEPVILSVHTNETMNNLRFKWKKEGGSWDSGQNINIEDTSYAYVFNPLEDGVYTLRAQGRDLALNWSRADDITITIDRIDPDSPTNTGFNSRVPDYAQEPTEIACGGATNLNQVSHHWSIIDDAVNYQRQWVYPGDDPNIEGNWHGSEQWTTNYTNYRTFGGASGTQGLWHVRVKAQDLAGNWSEYSDACAITFDQTPPATPTGLQRLSRYDHSIIFACEDTVPIQSMHPDWDDNTEDDLSHYEYTSFDAPNGSVGTRRVFEESIFEYNGPWMPGEGTYGFVVRAVDNAGNKSAWALGGEETFEGSCQITYDDTAPTIVQDPAEEVIFLNEGD
ncbi:hypothetical protein K8R20_02480, partial [bacterium]|nr:hypothetical protein [bacterium]